MKYYIERNSLLDNSLEISFEKLKDLFFSIYKYFSNMQAFDVAKHGVWETPKWGGAKYQIIPPLFESSPEVFFLTNLNSEYIYPISDFYEDYSEEELFTVIEILYDKIAIYNYNTEQLETDEIKKQFATQINNILKFYNGGYFLEINSGFITKGTTDSLKEMLSEDLTTILNDDVMNKLKTAIKLYYRFDSNLESKKKAINILADILEPVRKQLQDILNEKYEISKNDHDKLIFDIVNNFNIRHNNKKQYTDYSLAIWYDWMMQYYSSVIITYYKLIKENS